MDCDRSIFYFFLKVNMIEDLIQLVVIMNINFNNHNNLVFKYLISTKLIIKKELIIFILNIINSIYLKLYAKSTHMSALIYKNPVRLMLNYSPSNESFENKRFSVNKFA